VCTEMQPYTGHVVAVPSSIVSFHTVKAAASCVQWHSSPLSSDTSPQLWFYVQVSTRAE